MRKILTQVSLTKGLVFALALSFSASSCKDAQSEGAGTTQDSTVVSVSHPPSTFDLRKIAHQFNGWVDDIPVKMSLELDQEKASGTITYLNTQREATFTGTIDFMGRFTLRVKGENGDNLTSGIFLDNENLRGFWDHQLGAEPFEFIASANEQQNALTNPAELHQHILTCNQGNCTFSVETPSLPLARQNIITLLPIAVCGSTAPCPSPDWRSHIAHADSLLLSGWTGPKQNEAIVMPQYWTFVLKPKPQMVLLSDFIANPTEFVNRMKAKNGGVPLQLLNEFDFTIDPTRLLVSTVSNNGTRVWMEFGAGEIRDILKPGHPVTNLILKNNPI